VSEKIACYFLVFNLFLDYPRINLYMRGNYDQTSRY